MRLKMLLCPLLAAMLTAEQTQQSEPRTSILCGRDFVRAVTSACGQSRWKRVYEQPLEGAGSARAEFVQTTSKNGPSNTKSQSVLDLNNLPWVKYPRKRNINNGLHEKCCELGCTEQEISELC